MCTYATAQELPSDQQPINAPVHHFPDFSVDEGSYVENQPCITGRIALYPGSRTYPDDLRDMGVRMSGCSVDEDAEEIEIATDECLSGEYYARDNIKLLEPPVCDDGSAPTLEFYQNRRCTGSPRKKIHDLDELTGRCLWSEDEVPISSYYWSLIYRCSLGPDEGPIDGAYMHLTAEPSTILQNVLGGAPGSIRHHFGTRFPCHSAWANGTHTSSWKTDECRWSWNFSDELDSIEIVTPAVCSNGTRAQLALYENNGGSPREYKCNGQEMTLANGMMDVDDWLLNTCIDMSRVALLRGGFGRALGVMFFCDGQQMKRELTDKDEEEKEVISYEPRGSKVSHSDCYHKSGGPYQPPTYMYVKPMTCMSLQQSQMVRISEKPVCKDGSKGRMAVWDDAGCPGMPGWIVPINTLACESSQMDHEASYMLWCDGEDRVKDQKHLKNSKGVVAGDSRAVITWTECPRLNMPPNTQVIGRQDGPTIRRVDADKNCVGIHRDDQLTVFDNAKCPRGRAARLSVYENSRCRGKPDRTVDVRRLMNTCTPICADKKYKYSCGVKFTCV